MALPRDWEVEKSKGIDLLAPAVFRQLMSWAMQGLVGAVIGGPACRTASQCRSHDDDGPRPVRGRGEFCWGLPNLNGSLQSIVQEDNVLWPRFLLVYAVRG